MRLPKLADLFRKIGPRRAEKERPRVDPVKRTEESLGTHKYFRDLSPPASPPMVNVPHVGEVLRGMMQKPRGKVDPKQQAKLDKAQRFADLVGVIDPSGVVDAVNAGVSLTRAAKEPERRGEHLKNAAISGVSIIPLIGDLAKLLKVGRGSKAAAAATKVKSRAAGHAATAAPRKESFVSRVLSGAQQWGPIALAGAQTVFAKHDQSQNSKATRPSSPSASILDSLKTWFGSGRPQGGAKSDVTNPATGRTIDNPSAPKTSGRFTGFSVSPSAEKTDWPFRQAGARQQTPLGGSSHAAATHSDPAPSTPNRSIWQRITSAMSRRPKMPSGTSRRLGELAGDPAPPPVVHSDAHSSEQAPSRRPKRTFGQRVAAATSSVSAGIASVLGVSKEQRSDPHQSIHTSTSSANALKSGTNFGDVLSGRKKLEDAEKEIEGNRQLAESKKKLADAVKTTTGRLGGLALTAVALVKGLDKINAATLARQTALAQFSAGHSLAAGRAEAFQIGSNIRTGRATGASFARLTEANNNFQRALEPGRQLMTNVSNNLLTHLTTWFTELIEIGNELARRGGQGAQAGARGAAVAGGGGIGGVGGAVIGDRAIDALKNAARSNDQPIAGEPWQQTWNDIAAGKYKGSRSPRKL